MSENPFQSPMSDSYRPGDGRHDLREIARYQRWVIIALLINIVLNVVALFLGQAIQANPFIQIAFAGIAIAGVLFGVVAIFLLAQKMMGTGMAVLCAILMCVPCVSLIMLLVVNQKATSTLQRAGVKVGFLGANEQNI